MGEVDVVVAVVPPALHDLDSLGRDKSGDPPKTDSSMAATDLSLMATI